jgi:small-conductance mechanosensitive channel
VIGHEVTNYVPASMLAARVTIGYDVSWRQVHELLLAAAARTAGVLAEPRPYVVQRALSDFYIDYELRVAAARIEDRFKTGSTLHANSQDVFNEVGIQIMVPHFEEQPNQRVVVPRDSTGVKPGGEPPAIAAAAEREGGGSAPGPLP